VTGVTCPTMRMHPAIVAHACVHQIGPDQEGFFRFYEREVLPKVRGTRAGQAA
jgi:hypothetical protein